MTTATIRLYHAECCPRPRLGVVARLGQWIARRQMSTLLTMDDHMLQDLGITKDDVRHVRQLPLSTDAGVELTRIALSRGTNM